MSELVSRLSLRETGRSEADIQSDIAALLLFGGLNLDDPEVRLETPAPSRRRIDIEVGFTVIECKKDLSVGNIREEATEQLKGYVRDRTAELGQRYAGVLTDGREWRLFHFDHATDSLTELAVLELSPADPDVEGLLVWLETVLSTAEVITPTPFEVRRRLASDSPGFELDLAELRDIYEQLSGTPEMQQKRELWARLLAAAFGRNFEDDTKLFIEHTYLVLTAELIAHAVLGFDLKTGDIGAEALVTGKRFSEAGIGGVVEADFFDWPAESQQGTAFVESLARRLARFAWKDVEHDVLKVLYESVIDPRTRHDLGEYYTPDWLAQEIVEATIDEPLSQRVLDPACGSGTFLFWAIRAHLEAAMSAGQTSREAVNGAVSHVFGIDLHPVAVTLARVTYLLAIGGERLQERDPISIPVYLGDSIQLNQKTSVLSPGALTVPTADEMELFEQELNFPESLVADPGRFDRFVEDLAAKAATRMGDGKPPAIGQMMTGAQIDDPADRKMIEDTYRVLCHLYDHHRDHIWGYYVRNLARPLEFTREQHRVDRLVGNPPWLRYNAMTSQTRDDFRRLTRERNLQAPAQVVTSQDLSALFVARCVELYLRLDGKFGFVMPVATLSRLQYGGFRAADYSSQTATAYVAFEQPWELSGITPQPFPVPAAVLYGSRVDAGGVKALPASAIWWSGAIPDHHRSRDEVAELLAKADGEVTVAGEDFESPYADFVRQGSNLVPRRLVLVRPREAGPLGTITGRIAVESDERGPQKEPWREYRLSGAVEERFIKPVLLGDSLLPFRLRGERLGIIPWDGTKLLDAEGEEIGGYPGLAEWWSEAERIWRRHRTADRDLVGQLDYQQKLRHQFPLKEHRVAYTGRGAKVTAARISDRDAVVDHALYAAAFETRDEALYVSTVINTDELDRRIQPALNVGQFGQRNIHRAPFLVSWPQFDPSESLHREIAAAGERAEAVALSAEDVEEPRGIASARKRVRTALAADGIAAEIEDLVARLLPPD